MSAAITNVSARSKVDQVKDRLRALIYQGRLHAGHRLPPERELAKQFSVSTPTLNKAMAALEADGLLDRTVGRGTFVREGVVAGGTVAVVFDYRELARGVPFYETLMNSLLAEVSRHKMRPQFILGRGDSDEAFTQSLELASPLWRQVVGVIMVAWHGNFEDQMAKNGKPVVVLSAYEEGRRRVQFDYPALIRMSCEHLAGKGYREIGLITESGDAPGKDGAKIARSFGEVTSELGLIVKPQWRKLNVNTSAAAGRAAMHQLWEGSDRPRAILVSDENVAVGVGEAMLELGVRCPEDLAVVSHRTTGVDLAMPLKFTQCCFDLREMCATAWSFLDRLIAGDPEVPAVLKVEPHLVPGKTT
jgi:DNA-binding LacI/PurR family transcriptional regulator